MSAIKTKTDTINWTDIVNLPSTIWNYSGRTLTALGSVANDVWTASNRTLTDYATTTMATAIWNNATRTLTNYGNDITAADVWSYIGTITHSGQIGSWTASLTDVQSVQTGQGYRAKVYTNNSNVATNSYAAPRIYIYDVSRNVVISDIPMTNIGAGIYEYVYNVPNGAVQGNWETIIRTEVLAGSVIEISDYWTVEGSPAQVIINSISDDTIPSIGANITITNEGLSGYEYQYAWCVVTNANDLCDGVGDIFYGTAAKYINPGEDWNTNLLATVPNIGNYHFKLIVYFGTDSSGASRSFTARTATVTPPNGGGGGGGGGGGEIVIPPVIATSTATTTPTTVCSGADFNHDKKVNSIDFSILLSFWKTAWPFRNPCVDINNDKKVDSVEFSILMYQWGKKL